MKINITSKKNVIILLITILLFFIIISKPDILINSVMYSTELFISKLFVSLFPFFILSEILLNYNFHYFISLIFKNIFIKLFNLNSISSTIIILSIFTGHPANAKYIKDYLDKGLISDKEATKILMYSFFPSPVFVITVVGFLMLGSIKTGIILLLLIYFFNFSFAYIFRKKIDIPITNNSLVYKEPVIVSKVLKLSIMNSFNTLMIILGNIIIFTLLFNIINEIITIPPIIDSIFSSLIELTSGIKKISSLNTDFNLKFSLSLFALMFSGLCIHSQASSILSEYKINYKIVLKYRLFISIISFIITYTLTIIIY